MKIRRRITDERGQSATEFALVLPILCLLLFGVIQFGILYNNYVTLTDAVRAGARKATVSRRAADPVDSTVTAVRSAASGLDDDELDVTVASSWQHGTDVTVEATYPYSIDLMGLVLASGDLRSRTTERVE
jgi:Flp pilus assembly protein TadG